MLITWGLFTSWVTVSSTTIFCYSEQIDMAYSKLGGNYESKYSCLLGSSWRHATIMALMKCHWVVYLFLISDGDVYLWGNDIFVSFWHWRKSARTCVMHHCPPGGTHKATSYSHLIQPPKHVLIKVMLLLILSDLLWSFSLHQLLSLFDLSRAEYHLTE